MAKHVQRRIRSFKLMRFFSTASLAGIVCVTACLFWAYREFTVRQLIEHESSANVDLTRAFANTVWNEYRSFVARTAGMSREALLADPAQVRLREEVLAKMRGLKVAKIKVYNLDGLTVFSSEPRQIGEDKRGNAGFQAAREGRVLSDITYRDRFDAFESVLSDRNLVFSYIPVRSSPQAAVEGVFEVYSDVTELLRRQSRAQWQIAAIVFAALGLLYLFLFFVVRKADRIIATQDRRRAEQEEQIRHQAYHDALTGLPNRVSFTDRLREALSAALRQGRIGAVMFMDLDRFKIVNDSLGHLAGDLLLKEVAARTAQCLRAGDLLFRMGGDEFMVILPEIAGPAYAAHVAQRIIDAVGRPVSIYEHELGVGATVGIAVFPEDGTDAETLVKNADAAMYSAKELGRGRHAFYRQEMNERALQRLELEAALKKAFAEGQFVLHYQPRLDASRGRIVAVEALLRWKRPGAGIVLPAEFLDVLEDIGLMPIVGEWVLRSACTQLRQWHEQGMRSVRISVNVSARQFRNPGFGAMVSRVVTDVGVAPGSIELELAESILLTQPEQASDMVAALRSMGVRVSIDDFGTGHTSLNYLRRLAADILKLDRSFISDVTGNARDRAIVTAISRLAESLGMTVVAEGVETQAQADFLASIRCHEVQGYLFGAPAPAEQLTTALRQAGAAGFDDTESSVGTAPTLPMSLAPA